MTVFERLEVAGVAGDRLELEDYAPHFLGVVGNAWQRLTSADYRARFGIGIVEWRVLASLMVLVEVPAQRICDLIRIDKAAASRALGLLETRDLVASSGSASDRRARIWRLTEAGRQMHDAVLTAARAHEAQLLSGIPEAELRAFFSAIRRMRDNMDQALAGMDLSE